MIYWVYTIDGKPIRQATSEEVEASRVDIGWDYWHARFLIADDVKRIFVPVRICEVQDPDKHPEYRYCRVHPDVGAYRVSEGCDYCRGDE